MASLNQLQTEVTAWLNRKDLSALIPGWVKMTEIDIGEMLRARCMVQRATQAVDAAFVTMPPGWLTVESLRSSCCGAPLNLEDRYSGPLAGNCGRCGGPRPVSAYRFVGNCIEFLPHPLTPDPLPVGWKAPTVEMAWYQAPKPLLDPQDTNGVLEQFYSIYLFGVTKYGAMFELDDDRAAQMKDAFEGAVAQANMWKMTSDYSGAPLRAVVRGF